MKFSAPVNSRLRADRLEVESVDQPLQSFTLRDPVTVKISQLDRSATTMAIVCGALGGALILGFVHYAVKFPGP